MEISLIFKLRKLMTGWWLSCTPLKNMTSSIGIITLPKYGKHVPNHQPVSNHPAGSQTIGTLCELVQITMPFMIIGGKTHYFCKIYGPFSIAMLVYQRLIPIKSHFQSPFSRGSSYGFPMVFPWFSLKTAPFFLEHL